MPWPCPHPKESNVHGSSDVHVGVAPATTFASDSIPNRNRVRPNRASIVSTVCGSRLSPFPNFRLPNNPSYPRQAAPLLAASVFSFPAISPPISLPRTRLTPKNFPSVKASAMHLNASRTANVFFSQPLRILLSNKKLDAALLSSQEVRRSSTGGPGRPSKEC